MKLKNKLLRAIGITDIFVGLILIVIIRVDGIHLTEGEIWMKDWRFFIVALAAMGFGLWCVYASEKE